MKLFCQPQTISPLIELNIPRDFCLKCARQRNAMSSIGAQKDVNNIKDCLKLLNERGENIPRFVSHFLDELPPVGFGSMDALALLGRMERFSREVSTLRGALETQANVSKNLGVVTAALDRRMTDIEETRGSPGRVGAASGSQERETQGSAGLTRQSPAGSVYVAILRLADPKLTGTMQLLHQERLAHSSSAL